MLLFHFHFTVKKKLKNLMVSILFSPWNRYDNELMIHFRTLVGLPNIEEPRQLLSVVTFCSWNDRSRVISWHGNQITFNDLDSLFVACRTWCVWRCREHKHIYVRLQSETFPSPEPVSHNARLSPQIVPSSHWVFRSHLESSTELHSPRSISS